MFLLDKKYSSEALSDLSRDVYEAFDPEMQPANKLIPVNEHGFADGAYYVKIIWSPYQ